MYCDSQELNLIRTHIQHTQRATKSSCNILNKYASTRYLIIYLDTQTFSRYLLATSDYVSLSKISTLLKGKVRAFNYYNFTKLIQPTLLIFSTLNIRTQMHFSIFQSRGKRGSKSASPYPHGLLTQQYSHNFFLT